MRWLYVLLVALTIGGCANNHEYAKRRCAEVPADQRAMCEVYVIEGRRNAVLQSDVVMPVSCR